MPKRGFEPPRAKAHSALNAACLPVPPLRHAQCKHLVNTSALTADFSTKCYNFSMIKRASLLLFLLLLAIILNVFLNPIPKTNVPEGFKPEYGVSYSFEQAGWYGLDARKSYVELLDSVKFNWVRLPFFWDQMTDENGNLKIDDLEFAISEADRRDVKVVIALGLKTPYYPEYHLPEYIALQLKFGERIDANYPIADDLLAIDGKLVSALSKYENISHWQVENEPYLANVNNWKIEKDLISKEIEVVRKTDPKKRPIILNHVGPTLFDRKYLDLLPLLLPGDVFSINAYFKTQGTYLLSFEVFDRKVNIAWPKWLVWPVQSWTFFSVDFEKVKKEVEGKDIEFWVLEMQAEPYIREREDGMRKNLSFSPRDLKGADKFLRSYKIESVGLWGTHFWQFREKIGDRFWMDTVKSVVN